MRTCQSFLINWHRCHLNGNILCLVCSSPTELAAWSVLSMAHLVALATAFKVKSMVVALATAFEVKPIVETCHGHVYILTRVLFHSPGEGPAL